MNMPFDSKAIVEFLAKTKIKPSSLINQCLYVYIFVWFLYKNSLALT